MSNPLDGFMQELVRNGEKLERAEMLRKRNDKASLNEALRLYEELIEWNGTTPQIEQWKREINEKLTVCTRKELGVCLHCGGSFKGLFSRKCSRCGKPKDY